MNAKKINIILSISALILTVVMGILFINVCSTISSGIVEVGNNSPLFISLGAVAGIIFLLDVVICIFVIVHQGQALNSFILFSLIITAFLSILVFMLLFSI